MNINPFINLINSILSLYSFGMIIWMITDWLVHFNILNRYQIVVKNILNFGVHAFGPVLMKIRRYLPIIGGIDLSPIVVILVIGFVKEAMFTYLYRI